MEEYIGANLMIKTHTATHIGILQSIETEKELLYIEEAGLPKKINIREIDEVEILPLDDPMEHPMEKERTTIKEERKDRGKVVDHLTIEQYKEAIDLSDSFYGPSYDEIVQSGARGVLHLFVNIYKVMDRRFIVYIDSGIFSEIAVALARLCLVYNVDVTLVPSEKRTQRICKQLFYYQNTGGRVYHEREGQTIIIIADLEIRDHMIKGAEKVILLGETYEDSIPNKETIFFGAPVSRSNRIPSNSILCDVGFSPRIHHNYNLKKYSPKLLQKLSTK
ncbi:hypothetical protein NEFER03_0919 [Nematocida sp. LUAm3]|nr:hypothetical protein NEFER03_0919 [Nematocida sp. LUAm3]KAI5174937.1 hypothetical protein NEFER02_1037 [Nematocida sp. LUAm2]KAI5177464.1 hypothetical protein NEFER01_0714 [Nematocida sp. LUAm1]